MLQKSYLFSLFVMLTLASFSSCSSKPKDANTEEPIEALGADSGLNLELSGDSDSGKAGGLRTVYFAYDSAEISASVRATLDANVEFLKANPKVEVQVEGHCDERGGIQYNLALGEKRAKAVSSYFSTLGVESRRITTISFGKEKPIAFGHSEESWSQNRRANFVVTAK